MNLFSHGQTVDASKALRRQHGMTLVEVMLASGLMVIVIGGLLSANLVGLQQDQLIESMAGANDTSRNAVNLMLEDIRLAKGYNVGYFSTGSSFTACTNGTAQQGTAVLLYPIVNSTNQAVDTTKSVLYYFDSSDSINNDGRLWRTSNIPGDPMSGTIIASNLINTLYFTSETFLGATQVNTTYKGVVHATLQFCEYQYPLTKVGSNCLYEYYRMDCRATPHLPDGP
jgi:type II secretory pathway pseudopilin PulG